MDILIISPEKTLFEGEAESVILPGTEGSFGVLNHHMPFVSILKQGRIEWYDKNRNRSEIEIKGGVAEVRDNKLTVLVD
jgi:F-type H+-transporting ATPase subunit epsilon